MRVSTVLRTVALAALGSGFLLAQMPVGLAQPAKKTTMSAEDKKAKSLQCSKEADAKGLHGKERKAFRSKCKRGTT